MSNVKSRLSDLLQKSLGLKARLGINDTKHRISELEELVAASGFWKGDKYEAKKLMQELADLKKEYREFNDLSDEISLLNALSKEGVSENDVSRLEKNLNKMMLATFLSGPHDKKNAIVSIHAGQGGVEAMDWVNMLYRMYVKFCERKGWKAVELEKTQGEEAGLKSVSFKVEGRYVYGYLKNEAGTHRLVRQSPFNADKLRQTSFARVEVLPEFGKVDLPDIVIRDEDLEWQFFRSSGPGGQNVNKVSTAVRLTHVPSAIVVTAQTQRSQSQNRVVAKDILRSKLWLKEKVRAEGEKKQLKGEYMPASWGTQIRSYVLHPYKMIKDLRTKVEVSDTEGVLAGELEPFIEAEIKL